MTNGKTNRRRPPIAGAGLAAGAAASRGAAGTPGDPADGAGKPPDAGGEVRETPSPRRGAAATLNPRPCEKSVLNNPRPNRTVRSFSIDIAQRRANATKIEPNRSVRVGRHRRAQGLWKQNLERRTAAQATAAPSGARSWTARAQVFLAAGFDGASMNDIARAAGVSKGTLYAYFNSKDELFEAIIRGEFAQAAERLCAFRREGDVRAMLTDFGVRLIGRMSAPETLALARVVVAAVEKFPKIGRAFYEAGPLYGATRLAAELVALEKAGALKVPDPGARRLAVRRSLPELCLQARAVRRGRQREQRRDRGRCHGRGRGVPEGLRRLSGSQKSSRRFLARERANSEASRAGSQFHGNAQRARFPIESI